MLGSVTNRNCWKSRGAIQPGDFVQLDIDGGHGREIEDDEEAPEVPGVDESNPEERRLACPKNREIEECDSVLGEDRTNPDTRMEYLSPDLRVDDAGEYIGQKVRDAEEDLPALDARQHVRAEQPHRDGDRQEQRRPDQVVCERFEENAILEQLDEILQSDEIDRAIT